MWMSSKDQKGKAAKVPTKEVDVEKGTSVQMKDVAKGGKPDTSENTSTVGTAPDNSVEPPKKSLSFWALMLVLRPFFWPSEGSDGAFVNRVRSSSTWLCVGASKACSLASPLFLSTATNDLISGNWIPAVNSMIAFIVLRFASSLFKELQSLVYVKVRQQAAIELAQSTFKHVHDLSLNWHHSKQTGSVIKSIDRGNDAANTLITYLFLFLIPAIAECLAVVCLFFGQFRQWGLGVLVFGGVLIYSVTTVIITQWRKKFRDNQNKHDNDFHNKSTDSIINYETVKYFCAEKHELDRFSKGVRKFQTYNSAVSITLSILNLAQQLILALTMIGCMLISGQAVIKGEMTLGGWVAVQSWVAQIFVPLNFLGTVYGMIVQGFIDVKNLSELLSERPEVVDEPHAKPLTFSPTETARGLSISFTDVAFHYPEQPEEKGLKNLTFEVPAGTTTAICGHTGAGKSTISRLLFRFYDPLQGKVCIANNNIRKFTMESVRQLIGVVPQDTVLFNDTILYNIQYGRQNATFDEVVAAAEAAQIRDFIESLPDKWDTQVGERGLKLSGGEKQRVSIARCLLKNPPIVLLDEATSALDTLTEQSVQDALNVLGQSRTVIIIAHRLSTIKNASQIIVLGQGSILEKGTHDELLARDSSHYKDMWTLQGRVATGAEIESTSSDVAQAAESGENQI